MVFFSLNSLVNTFFKILIMSESHEEKLNEVIDPKELICSLCRKRGVYKCKVTVNINKLN